MAPSLDQAHFGLKNGLKMACLNMACFKNGLSQD